MRFGRLLMHFDDDHAACADKAGHSRSRKSTGEFLVLVAIILGGLIVRHRSGGGIARS